MVTILGDLTGIPKECFFSFSSKYFSILSWQFVTTRVGNVFGCVCLCVCLSVCRSVQTITFEPLYVETSFLVCRYILTISRSSLSIEVIGSRSRSHEKNDNFTYFNM